jgi:D-alanine--poly(phosphoribitol) ligase subunit 2
MSLNKEAIEAEIKASNVKLLHRPETMPPNWGVDEIIPATGLIDSTGLLELIAWYEKTYQIPLTQEEINIDNLGTLARMAEFVLRKKGLL